MIGFLNAIINGFASIVVTILNLLPQTPFSWDLGALGPYWAYVNYFVPFGTLSGIMATYLLSVMIWYGVRWVLRFVRYID